MAESGARRFSRHVAWTLAAKVAVAGSSLLSGVIVARWLGAGAVGVVASLSVITMIAINVGGLGLPSAVTFLVARDNRTVKRILVNSVIFGVIAGTVIAGSIILIASLRPGLFGDVPPRLVTIAALALPVQMLSYLALAIYLGLERIRAYNLADLSLQAIILANAFVTLVVLGLGLPELIVIGTAANVIAGIAIVIALSRTIRPIEGNWKADPARLSEMLGYGWRFFVAMVAGLIVLRGDLLLVNYFRGSADAGVYSVSTQVSTLLQMIPAVISTILFPRTAGAQDPSGTMTCRVTRHAVLILLCICLAAVPAAFVLPLLYGPAFADVPWQFLILLPGVYLLGLETIQVQHFTGLGLPAAIPVFWIVVMALNVGLNLALIPRFGGYGAAVSSTIAYTAIFALVAVYFHKRTGRSLSEAFLIKKGEIAGTLRSFTTQAKTSEAEV